MASLGSRDPLWFFAGLCDSVLRINQPISVSASVATPRSTAIQRRPSLAPAWQGDEIVWTKRVDDQRSVITVAQSVLLLLFRCLRRDPCLMGDRDPDAQVRSRRVKFAARAPYPPVPGRVKSSFRKKECPRQTARLSRGASPRAALLPTALAGRRRGTGPIVGLGGQWRWYRRIRRWRRNRLRDVAYRSRGRVPGFPVARECIPPLAGSITWAPPPGSTG